MSRSCFLDRYWSHLTKYSNIKLQIPKFQSLVVSNCSNCSKFQTDRFSICLQFQCFIDSKTFHVLIDIDLIFKISKNGLDESSGLFGPSVPKLSKSKMFKLLGYPQRICSKRVQYCFELYGLPKLRVQSCGLSKIRLYWTPFQTTCKP